MTFRRCLYGFSILMATCCLGGSDTPTPAPGASPVPGWEVFGSDIRGEEAIPVARLLGNPGVWDGRTVLVEGPVAAVCQKKGCWMTMRDGERDMRIRFKDYGFFVPKDCSGRTARIEGVFSVQEIPVEEARHYLEDAGRGEEASGITEPQKQLTLLASGVQLKN